jgi:hypothetical protein
VRLGAAHRSGDGPHLHGLHADRPSPGAGDVHAHRHLAHLHAVLHGHHHREVAGQAAGHGAQAGKRAAHRGGAHARRPRHGAGAQVPLPPAVGLHALQRRHGLRAALHGVRELRQRRGPLPVLCADGHLRHAAGCIPGGRVPRGHRAARGKRRVRPHADDLSQPHRQPGRCAAESPPQPARDGIRVAQGAAAERRRAQRRRPGAAAHGQQVHLPDERRGHGAPVSRHVGEPVHGALFHHRGHRGGAAVRLQRLRGDLRVGAPGRGHRLHL